MVVAEQGRLRRGGTLRKAIVVEVPAVGAGAAAGGGVVVVAVAAEGEEVGGVYRFDVLGYLVGPSLAIGFM